MERSESALVADTTRPPWTAAARRGARNGAVAGAIPALGVLALELTGAGTWWIVLFLLFPVGALVGAVGLALTAFRRARPTGILLLATSLAFLAVLFVGFQLGWPARRFAFRRLAERSQPLVAAIRAFEDEHARPPSVLADLVPEYLPEVPGTGMTECPEYEYAVFDPDGVAGRRWQLSVPCSLGLFNWDEFVYWPGEDYPPSGAWERIGTWAYFHE